MPRHAKTGDAINYVQSPIKLHWIPDGNRHADIVQIILVELCICSEECVSIAGKVYSTIQCMHICGNDPLIN